MEYKYLDYHAKVNSRECCFKGGGGGGIKRPQHVLIKKVLTYITIYIYICMYNMQNISKRTKTYIMYEINYFDALWLEFFRFLTINSY